MIIILSFYDGRRVVVVVVHGGGWVGGWVIDRSINRLRAAPGPGWMIEGGGASGGLKNPRRGPVTTLPINHIVFLKCDETLAPASRCCSVGAQTS
jgi:hypothetical protein